MNLQAITDPFYAFLIFLAAAALDVLCAGVWLPVYYRFGIPLYSRRRRLNDLAGSEIETSRLAAALSERFRARPEHPSILFKALSEREIAAREKLFENRGGIRYLPVVHSLIRLHPERESVTVMGYINAYVLVALVYAAYRSTQETSFIPVALLILVVLGLSYAAQAGLNHHILDQITLDPP